MFLKQSTASQVVEFGPFIDDTDFKTAETALSIANTDIKLRKGGGTTHGNKNSGGATHIANGYYHFTLDATDTDTVGQLDVHCNMSGALAVWTRFYVLEEAVYDALFGASALGYVANAPVNVAQISGDATAADNLEAAADGTGYNLGGGSIVAASVTGAVGSVTGNVGGNVTGSVGSVATGGITAASIATGAIDADALAADAAGEIADAVWDEARSGHVAAGSFGEGVASVQGNVTGSVASVTGAVGSVTGNVGGSVASVTAGVTVTTNNDKTGYAIGTGGIAAAAFAAGAIDAAALAADAVDEILDEQIGDSTVTMRQALKLLAATLGGKLSGAATTTVTIRNVADTTDVVTATVDANGNRSAVTLSL